MLRRLSLAILLITICTSASAQNSLLFGPTNAGTEFWVSFPANWEYQAKQKYVRLYITSSVRTKVDVWTGQNLLKTIYTIPYDIVTVDIPSYDAQASIVRADVDPVPNDQVYVNKAIHITADDPIVVYGINRTTYSSDGMLLLPVNALGQEYVVAAATDIADGSTQKLPSQYMVIAPYDNTTVTIINPMVTPNHKAGEQFSITMNKGDVFSAMSVGFGGDLSGATISADKPVAVTAGENCTYLPDQKYPACDHLEEMLFPVSAWGKFYHSVPYATRLKGDLFRIFAGADSADIYINGVKYVMLPRKGGEEGIGWIEYLPQQRGLIEFSSDKPIMVAQYNNSSSYDGVATDPFYSVLAPMEQYQKEIVFTTPAADFPQNYVNIVCDSAALFGIEIASGGSTNWQKLVTLKGSDYQTFPTKINGRTYIGKSFAIDPGAYRMRGPRRFAGTLYGYGNYDSYGYPLAASVANISVNDTDNAIITQQIDCNGNVIGTVSDMPDAASLRTNLSSVVLDPTASSNYKLEVNPFVPSISPSTGYTIHVIDPTKDAMAVIVASDMHGNLTLDTVRYSATNVATDKQVIDFGNVYYSEQKTVTVSLMNHGANAITVDSLVLQSGQHFRIVQPKGAFTIPPSSSIQVQIDFADGEEGIVFDSLGIASSCGTLWLSQVRAIIFTGSDVPESQGTKAFATVSPNPVTGDAVLNYSITAKSSVQAVLFNADGKQARVLLSLPLVEPGEHTARLDLSGLPAGMYFVRFTAGGNTSTHPIVLLK